MKQILIKLAALGLLLSVVCTYACDTCGCKHKASDRFRDMETSNAGNNNTQPQAAKRISGFTEGGKELEIRRLFDDKEPNSDVSDEGKKIPDPWFRAEEPSEVGHPRNCGGYKDPCPSPGGIY